MFHIALFEPEIPPNTGNVIRLCANTGSQLHLIHPLGFQLDDRKLRRAGLDYREYSQVHEHASYENFLRDCQPARVFACSTKGKQCYANTSFIAGDAFLFGPESRGLPESLLAVFNKDQIIRIPMLQHSRSLNLSNAVSVIVYEAWRQLGFATV